MSCDGAHAESSMGQQTLGSGCFVMVCSHQQGTHITSLVPTCIYLPKVHKKDKGCSE